MYDNTYTNILIHIHILIHENNSSSLELINYFVKIPSPSGSIHSSIFINQFKILQSFPDVKYLLSTLYHIIVSLQACLLTRKDGEGHLPISNTLVDPLHQTLRSTPVQRINNCKFIARQCLKPDPMPL